MPPANPPMPPAAKQHEPMPLDPRVAAELALIEAEVMMIQMGLSPSKAPSGTPIRDISPLGAY